MPLQGAAAVCVRGSMVAGAAAGRQLLCVLGSLGACAAAVCRCRVLLQGPGAAAVSAWVLCAAAGCCWVLLLRLGAWCWCRGRVQLLCALRSLGVWRCALWSLLLLLLPEVRFERWCRRRVLLDMSLAVCALKPGCWHRWSALQSACAECGCRALPTEIFVLFGVYASAIWVCCEGAGLLGTGFSPDGCKL